MLEFAVGFLLAFFPRLRRGRRSRLPIVALVLAALLLIVLAGDAHAARLMISLVFGAIGAYFGGPIGFSLGFAVGGLLGNVLFPTKQPTLYGPRIEDKTVQSAAFGSHVTKHWGTDRLNAQLIFSSSLKEHIHKTTVGGKMGGSSQTSETPSYSIDIMLSFSRRAKGVRRIWADTKLIYDITGDPDLAHRWSKEGKHFTVRDGNENQLPSALEESYHGVGLCSAHRGLFCLEAADFQLANFANRIPNFTAEVFTEGETLFGKIGSYTPPSPPYSWWKGSWGYMDLNGEVWALYHPYSTPYWYNANSYIFHWGLDRPADPIQEFHPLWDGTLVQAASTANTIRLRSDEPSAMVHASTTTTHVVTYFQLESRTQISFDSADLDFHTAIELAVKYGDDAYLLHGNNLYFGFDPHHLMKVPVTGGAPIAETDMLHTEGGGADVRDMGRSEGFLWALFPSKILKIDPDTLALISTIDISGVANPLAMAVINDAEIRIMGATGDGTAFYVMRNEGAPVLENIATDTTYTGIRGFTKFGLRYFSGIYVVDFAGYIGGFPALIDFFGPGGEAFDVPLWKIVRDINIMAGLDSVIDAAPPTVGDIEVSELTDLVHGYSLTRGMTARSALQQLVFTYFFDCRESDLKLDYPKRGKAPVASLPGADLAARSSITEQLPDRLTRTRARETELPLRIHVVYNNWEASYQPGHEYAPRLITDARSTKTVEIAVAITSTKARQVAEVLLANAWLERDAFELKTSRKYLALDSADNIEVVITEE